MDFAVKYSLIGTCECLLNGRFNSLKQDPIERALGAVTFIELDIKPRQKIAGAVCGMSCGQC